MFECLPVSVATTTTRSRRRPSATARGRRFLRAGWFPWLCFSVSVGCFSIGHRFSVRSLVCCFGQHHPSLRCPGRPPRTRPHSVSSPETTGTTPRPPQPPPPRRRRRPHRHPEVVSVCCLPGSCRFAAAVSVSRAILAETPGAWKARAAFPWESAMAWERKPPRGRPGFSASEWCGPWPGRDPGTRKVNALVPLGAHETEMPEAVARIKNANVIGRPACARRHGRSCGTAHLGALEGAGASLGFRDARVSLQNPAVQIKERFRASRNATADDERHVGWHFSDRQTFVSAWRGDRQAAGEKGHQPQERFGAGKSVQNELA